MKARILIMGTSPQTKGGVSSVVNGYFSSSLTTKYIIKYITTHQDTNALIKLMTAMSGYVAVIVSLITFRPNLVHIHAASRASFYRKAPIVILFWLLRKPIVYHHHGGEFMQFYRNESGNYKRRFIRWVFRKPSRIIVLSESWKENFLSIDNNLPITVLRNAVCIPGIGLTKAPQPKVTILFMGQIVQRKGVLDLLNAAIQLLEGNLDFQFILGGIGEIDFFQNYCQSKGVQDVVDFRGWVAGEEKESLFQLADIFVLPSYNEGLPMSILEAISYGIPVVATPVGGVREAVVDGLNGYLIQPGDVNHLARRLNELIVNDKLRLELGKASRRLAEEKFDLSNMVKKLVIIYSGTLEKHRVRP